MYFAKPPKLQTKLAEITNQTRRNYKPNSPNLQTKLAEFADQTRRICFLVKHEMKSLTHSLVVLYGGGGDYLFFADLSGYYFFPSYFRFFSFGVSNKLGIFAAIFSQLLTCYRDESKHIGHTVTQGDNSVYVRTVCLCHHMLCVKK